MDLAVLEIFRAVAQEKSVTRAAQLLDRVQSNVTTRIKQLEEELGTVLFLREGKRMLLTTEGERFLGYAEKLLSLADEARQSLHPGQPHGNLRIGAMESTAATRLPTPLAAFHSRWPEVSLSITTGTSEDLIDAVRDRRLDCALVADPAALPSCSFAHTVEEECLDWIRIYTEQLMLVLPAHHEPVSAPEKVKVRTLAGFGRGCTYREIAEDWFAGSAATPDQKLKVLPVNSYHAILACVASGSCVGIVPQSVLDLRREPLHLQAAPLMQVDTLLVSRAGFRTPAFEEFLRILQTP
jgi:DNA-binding transcriptional LysR family regulator